MINGLTSNLHDILITMRGTRAQRERQTCPRAGLVSLYASPESRAQEAGDLKETWPWKGGSRQAVLAETARIPKTDSLKRACVVSGEG